MSKQEGIVERDEMVPVSQAARMIRYASAQATDEAIRWLELIERCGTAHDIPSKALAELRAKSAALKEP